MLNFDQSVLTSSMDFGVSGNRSSLSGPRVALGSAELPLAPGVSSLVSSMGAFDFSGANQRLVCQVLMRFQNRLFQSELVLLLGVPMCFEGLFPSICMWNHICATSDLEVCQSHLRSSF